MDNALHQRPQTPAIWGCLVWPSRTTLSQLYPGKYTPTHTHTTSTPSLSILIKKPIFLLTTYESTFGISIPATKALVSTFYPVLIPVLGVYLLITNDLCHSLLDIVDIKPVNMEELTEVITATEFHPTQCNLFMYSSSKSNIKLADMRDSALCDRHAKCIFLLIDWELPFI